MKRENQAVKAQKLETEATVLLVEDDDWVRKWGYVALIKLGFKVLEARDGVEAVKVFKQYKDKISCLFCDLSMPRMDGWKTISAIRAIRHDLPVVLTSGYDKDIVMTTGEHSEMPDSFLDKPYDISKLGYVICHAMAHDKAVA